MDWRQASIFHFLSRSCLQGQQAAKNKDDRIEEETSND